MSSAFTKLLKYEDFKISTNKAIKSILKQKIRVNQVMDGERGIGLYTDTLREYGRLFANPEIDKIHSMNPHASPDNTGSIEGGVFP